MSIDFVHVLCVNRFYPCFILIHFQEFLKFLLGFFLDLIIIVNCVVRLPRVGMFL